MIVLCFLAGLACIAAGAGMLCLPAGIISAGVGLVLLALILSRGSGPDQHK